MFFATNLYPFELKINVVVAVLVKVTNNAYRQLLFNYKVILKTKSTENDFSFHKFSSDPLMGFFNFDGL